MAQSLFYTGASRAWTRTNCPPAYSPQKSNWPRQQRRTRQAVRMHETGEMMMMKVKLYLGGSFLAAWLAGMGIHVVGFHWQQE